MRLDTWLTKWLSLYVEPSRLRWSTVQMYRRSVEAVPSALGAIELSSAGAEEALALRAWLVQVGKETPRAAQLDRLMLSRSLAVAHSLGLTQRPLITPDTCPQIAHQAREAEVLTAEELRAYISAAPSAAPQSYPALFLCCCGLRRGEALGARRADLDADHHTLSIHGQLQRQRGCLRYVPCKTASSERTIVLPPFAWDACSAPPRTLKKLSPYIVSVSPEKLWDDHRAALRAARISKPVTLHGLRHTLATLAALEGCPMQQLQRLLGHSSIKLTADLYAHHLLFTPQDLLTRLPLDFAGHPGARLEIV